VAVLKVVSGDEAGRVAELAGERAVIGRHPNCQIVFENAAISRHHCQILESHGTFYLEDLRSRNGTHLNGQPVEGRTQLHENDQIRICDIIATFHFRNEDSTTTGSIVIASESDEDIQSYVDRGDRATDAAASARGSRVGGVGSISEEAAGIDKDHSSILSRGDSRHPDDLIRPSIKPELKLRAMMEISQALRRELELDAVLPKILETLFRIFPQADQGFILLKDPKSNKLRVKATRSRNPDQSDTVAVSMTVVRQVLASGEAILSSNVLDDSRFSSSTSLSALQIRAMMCVPLLDQDQSETVGVIQIDTSSIDPGFTEEDRDLLVSIGVQAEMALEIAKLHEEVLRQREMERDLDFATQVQLGFLPKERPKVLGYAFADYYEAALRVGGDYFDYITLPDGRLALALGDVAGKGMPAALLMARLYSSTRFELFTAKDPASALIGLNKEIASSGLGHRFITFVLMVLDPQTGEIAVVNAGHLPPFLRRRDGRVEAVAQKESGLPLGIVPDQEYQAVKMRLDPGDTLFAYTDGITEAMNDAREIYGRERLKKCVKRPFGGIGPLLKSIISDVETFTGGATHSRDDTCCVGVERMIDDPSSTQ
jgi:phosphoserine phosphatase RsbU/P